MVSVVSVVKVPKVSGHVNHRARQEMDKHVRLVSLMQYSKIRNPTIQPYTLT